MHKIGIIIQREFLTRIRKRSFLIMSILGPFLFAGLAILPAYFANMEDKEVKLIAVADSSRTLVGALKESDFIKFKYLDVAKPSDFKNILKKENYWGILYISPNILNNDPVTLYSYSQASMSTTIFIQEAIHKEIIKLKLITNKVESVDKVLSAVNANVNHKVIKLNEKGEGKEENAGLKMAVGYICGLLIYMFIFLFGTQVMRGVIEEKTNRIVEVIVSSVKPFELMMGKIIGIAGVGLLQFIIWVGLTLFLITGAQKTFAPELSKSATDKVLSQDIMSQGKTVTAAQPTHLDDKTVKFEELYNSVQSVNFGVIIGSFIFFFLGGYLLYGSLFAAIGSAVDSETDTQQFMLPITVPLILSMIIMVNTINSPESSLSFWFSIIPFTSPIIMMVRIPFGVPYWQIELSAGLLIATFIATTWLAGKIYKTGILMYGKKISYGEILKWIRYKS
jgi:ABC-2 type transport system permease protein